MVKRKDFRPNSSSYSMTDKDRETIRSKHVGYNTEQEVSEYKQVRARHGESYANKWFKAKYPNSDIPRTEHDKLEKGTSKESKEHPSLSKKQSEQVAKDHLKENPEYYDNIKGSSDKQLVKSEIQMMRESNYAAAIKNIENPPKKPWWMSQHEYDRERAMDREVVKARGKKAYIETTGEDTK